MKRMYKYIIKGVVQGVGFRPYIYCKAEKSGLKGYVKNIGGGVEVVINDNNFIKKLFDLPPLAKIESFTKESYGKTNSFQTFSILKSKASYGETSLPSDIYLCNDCLNELKDAKNRRYNYYFITCTNCGPRFTIIEDYPYDRPLTSMKEFTMCGACKKEYLNPHDRRYHAQTIACKNCGPKLKLMVKGRDKTQKSDSATIKNAAELIKNGEVLAIKGVGGFHLCSLSDDLPAAKVRKKLMREHKPFAVLVKDIKMARKIAFVSTLEKSALLSEKRPIVVLQKIDKHSFKKVSELNSIGVMLPYTAIHYMLFEYINCPILMTSCNLPGEPVAINEKIADNFLTHERRIVNRCDDSVIKIINGKILYLRRSRGFTPLPVKLPILCIDSLSLGAEMNSVVCAAKKSNAYLSQYIGETSKLETYEFLKDAVKNLITLTRLKPKIIASDLHPSYNSTIYADKLSSKFKAVHVKVQHHKAHVASAAAEYSLKDYVGIAMDGVGYGEDGKLWGGEVFDVTNEINFERIGHLEEQPLLGGDSAVIYPKKMLFGILSGFLNEKDLTKLELFNEKETKLYIKQLDENYNIQKTTSAGRVLDAASALLGVCNKRDYDGRPAMLLESAAYRKKPYDLKPVFEKKNSVIILKTMPLFKFLLKNINKDRGRLAATAQTYIAKGLYEIAKQRKKPIVFSGGVAYNEMISSFMINKRVLLNKEIPCGDGGIAYGQAYLANAISNFVAKYK